MNKRSERQRETKRGTEREREKCPNSLRPNDQQWLYNLSTHAHIQRHVYLGTRTPFHSSGQDYDEIERHTQFMMQTIHVHALSRKIAARCLLSLVSWVFSALPSS